ncbi:MAG: glycosyltransferase family 4 protein [Verrucomicrobiota bacterium]|nr:glycosyltransferase family 4 protein [Verrucomicrobiota bacterium]
MTIGLVRRGYSETGGAEAYLKRFAEAAAAAGHGCVLFATEDWPAQSWPGKIVRIGRPSPRGFADGLEALRPREHCDFLFSLDRVWHCDAYRAGDGVHAVWLQRRAEHEPFWKPWLRGFSGKHRALLELEARLLGETGARLVIANSQMVKREIEQQFAYPAERVRVVYNGVPAFAEAPHSREWVRRELGLSETDYVLLFAGSGWERKGLRFAIEAIAAAARVRPALVVVGRGTTRVLPRSERVRFLGPVPRIAPYLAAADAFLLPTLYDPFSNACLEAVAAGLPVITTRYNGFAEIIEPGLEGEIIDEPRDVNGLAGAVAAWALPERRAAVRRRLQEKAAHFSIEENARQTLELIQGMGNR